MVGGLAKRLLWFAALLETAALLSSAQSSSTEGVEFFEKNIRPLFVENCYKCHSIEGERIRGGLRLDSLEGMLSGGDSGPALIPGDPEKSRLIIAVRHTDPDLQMPKDKLSAEKIKLLEEWVRIGAPYPAAKMESTPLAARMEVPTNFWAVRPVRMPPQAAVQNRSWVKEPLDRYVLAKLEANNLSPAPPADGRTLIRRATFDLIGLPPTAQEVEAFVADNSTNAFEKVVDRLLSSPQFGELWGRHWLDLARYADSNGLDLNAPFENSWRYRDYVIKAFNEDKSYREFIREQLAGDLLPAKDISDQHEKWIATGFLLLGPKNFAEPNRVKLLSDVVDEQIDVTTRAMLGLTVSCARCHDHKFDPIPTRDYYAMAGIFRSTSSLAEGTNRGAPRGTMLSERPLGDEEETKRYEKFAEELAKLQGDLQRALQMSRELPGGIDSKELDGICLDNLEAEVTGSWALSNYSTNFVDKNYLHDGNERAGKGKKLARFRPKIPQTGLYEIRLAYTPRANRATNVPVKVSTGMASKTVYLNQTVEPKYDKAFELLGTFELSEGTNNTVEVSTEGTKGFVVVDAVQFIPKDVQLAARLRGEKGLGEMPRMMAASGVTAMDREDLQYKVNVHLANAPPQLPTALAVREGRPADAPLYLRGDPDKAAGTVPRGFISVLKTGDGPLALEKAPLLTIKNRESSGRLELADWIASADNPLTARVHVNRIWHRLFGKGVVSTPDNFGVSGEPPSNPELLDYLAADFMSNEWSSKKLIRKIMLSSSYQMGSAHSAAAYAKDPDNNLLWRMNRKRLQAEQLRDAILATSKSLDATPGGSALISDARFPLVNRPMEELTRDSNRRSIYLPILRGNVPDFLQVFDFPDPHALNGRRHVTTAPTQALFMMNSPFLLRESARWAEQLVGTSGASDADLLERAWLDAFGRPAAAVEKEQGLAFIKTFESSLAPVEQDRSRRRLMAWKGLCQALFESTEFRYLD